MNVKIIEEKANRLMFDVEGASHTISNAIKRQLFEDEDVKVSGYHVSHPLIGTPRFIVETKRGNDPRKAILDSLKNLKKQTEDLSKKAFKELK
mgnify:CR=1 FL=1